MKEVAFTISPFKIGNFNTPSSEVPRESGNFKANVGL